MTPEELMELNNLKAEMHQDMLEDLRHEQRMYADMFFAIEQYENKLQEAYDILAGVSSELSKYGHDITPRELLKFI